MAHGDTGNTGRQWKDPVAGLLLAAGGGSRIGGPKAVIEVGGRRLVDRGVSTLSGGGCDPVMVVLGAADTPVRGAHTVINGDWATGMGSSVRAGIDALPDAVDAVLIALADQPLVTAEAVRRLLDAHAQGARAAVATYGGNPRNPVLLGREHWSAVYNMAVRDTGARPFLRAYSHLVTAVACDDIASPQDIDTVEDLERVSGLLKGA
ncbi:NTP transferase domain-containing protein [Nocardiopsis sp. CNT312]|uniref:nucleotidyltransferase family protein n=1 Tax=Nocardiopsis sp. CNT312 TaxID=1137268 RepID=UPI0004BAA2DF|nr:nucleotidyltransferase family protein [Nocardiopsis sp. CNT312]